MKTVLHLAHVSVPQDARILRELNALSESSDLVLYAYGVLEDGLAPAHPQFRLRQFRVRSNRALRLPRPLRYALVLAELNTRFIARMLRLRPDVVHCHDTMVLPSGGLAKILLGSTVVYDAHELESDKAGQSNALSNATLLIEKACWRRIDKLITVSPSITTWYAQNLGPKPTACILNSPEIPELDSPVNESRRSGVREKLGIERDTPLFVYVGGLVSGRGIELILNSFAAPDMNAHVAFIGWGLLRDQIEAKARQHANIHYLQRVPHEELVGFIQQATGGFCLIEDVSLSDHLCLPNKLFEYAFAGLPVIASRLPEIERVVHDYQLGICTDLNETSVKKAIQDCITWPRDLPIARLDELSWQSQAANLRRVYKELPTPRSTSGLGEPGVWRAT